MGALLMLAGGSVNPGKGKPPTLSAYVVLSGGGLSRIFKVSGVIGNTRVVELPSATTVDLKRFQNEVQNDLEPALDALRMYALPASLEQPMSSVVCAIVREHLKESEGLDVR